MYNSIWELICGPHLGLLLKEQGEKSIYMGNTIWLLLGPFISNI